MTSAPGRPLASGAATATGLLLAARQGALAAEHAAIFGYAALGPRLGAADVAQARIDERAHRTERDALAAAITAAGAQPVASRAAYPLPDALTSTLAAQRLALQVEAACAQGWRYVLAVSAQPPGSVTSTAERAAAVRALTGAAVRAMRWRARIDPQSPTVPFPGL